MKPIFAIYIILLTTPIIYAQNQSMTISHSGLSPNDTLWVVPNEEITFIYGGGGAHPMKSGHGTTPSPIFFPTVTVNSTITTATFSLSQVGTYLFHCGTNPGNQNNWGVIIVEDVASSQNLTTPVQLLYPNPAVDYIVLPNEAEGVFEIFNENGQTVQKGFISSDRKVDISQLSLGRFILVCEFSTQRFFFIK